MIRPIVILILSFVVSFKTYGQLVTSNAMTPAQLVQNVLVGQGITVSNVTFSGNAEAIGDFVGSASNIGINQGVILSSGSVLDKTTGTGDKNGPVGPNNNAGASTAWFTDGDPQLTNLINNSTHDAVILEFDFVPQGDTIRFNYVFGSEEYIEFVDTASNLYNDVFAFFISGPGIVGQKNLAVIPGTNTPVSIGNVNQILNTSYFIQNGDGFNGTQTTDPTVVNFDGFTVPLIATAKVTPCETYHLKIALADGGDTGYDSGVFLQGGSLNSNPSFDYSKSLTFSPFSVDTLIPEGCSDGVVKFTRTEKLWDPFVLNFSVAGTADIGVDYDLSAMEVNFPANVSEVDINILTHGDALVEGSESVILRIANPSICIADSIDIEYTILDQEPISTNTILDTVNCPGEDVVLSPTVSGGVPGYSLAWAHGPTTNSVSVSPASTEKFYYTITDTCGTSKLDSGEVYVPNFQPLSVDISNDTSVRCPGMIVPLISSGVNGGGTYTYSWNTGATTNDLSDNVISSDTSFTVTVTDNCGATVSETVNILLNYPGFAINALNDTTICFGDAALLNSQTINGIPPFTYVWETGDLTQTTTYSGLTSQFVTVTATDSCGIVPVSDSVFVTLQKPTASFSINAPVPEILETVFMENASIGSQLTYSWNLGEGSVSTLTNPEVSYSQDTTYTVVLAVTDSLGCVDTTERTVEIFLPLYFYIPNAFTPNADGLNDEFVGKGVGVVEFELRIFDRWGIELFYTDNPREGWNGLSKTNKKVPDGVYVYKLYAAGGSGKEIEKVGIVTLLH